MTSCLPALLGRHAPHDPVLWGPEGAIDAAALHKRVSAVASRLPAGGQRAVLVSCVDTTAFVVAVLAAWGRGLSIALPPNTRERTLDEIRSEPNICAHLVDDDPRLASPFDDAARVGDGSPIMPGPEQHLASVYTSGSTGPHDIVHKSAAQLLGEADVLASAFGLDAASRVLSTVPPHHIYGLLFGVLLPLTCGGSIIAAVPLHAPAVEAVARERRATVLVSTPAHLRGLEVLDVGAMPSLRRVFSSGAPLHPSTAAKVRERFGCSVTEILGSTETGGIAWRSADGTDDVPWRPLPGVRVEASADGQMLLRSAFLPADAKQPVAADDRIELLGTAAENASEGPRFRHLGRLDDVVKVGGKRVALGVLEARLRSLPAVHDAAVIADAAPGGHDRRIRAAAVAPGADPEQLRRALLEWFDPVVVPRRIVLVDGLPREATGKLQRRMLKGLLDGEVGAARTRSADLVLRPLHGDDEDERRFDVEVPSDLVYFEGHFPGRPILSGVALLEAAALRPSQRAWPELGGLRQVQRLKFRQPIGPGERLTCRLHREGDRVTFELCRGDEPCASALLIFTGAGSG